MKQKRWTIVQRVVWILLAALLAAFGTGFIILRRLERSNMDYIYQLTRELVSSSISQMEDKITQAEDDLYRMIVSDEIQRGGTMLLESRHMQEEGEETYRQARRRRALGMTAIVDELQKQVSVNHAIVCANFLDSDNLVQVIAATGYYKLDEENAARVGGAAIEAAGSTILIDGPKLTGNDHILVMAKQLRERKNLSLAHIGVVVLFVDMEKVGEVLTDTHDAVYVIRDTENQVEYVLNRSGQELSEQAWTVAEENLQKQNGYSLITEKDSSWFAVTVKGERLSYLILTPYRKLFSQVRQFFRVAMLALIGCSAAVLAAAAMSAHRVTADIRKFIEHIHRISNEDFASLPLYENERIADRDIYELKNAFNAMAERINELVRENYTKQLLIKETQLSALQAQMNPHFLYNTLNSVYWMAKTEGEEPIAEMVNSLSLLLREAISAGELVIELDKELDIVCHYITIQKLRYGDRLDVAFDVSEECSDLAIPKFTLQPLLENAIVYGVECMLEPCAVTVRIFTEGEVCVCQVKNSGPAPEADLMEKLRSGQIVPRGNGVGLLNIDRRIKAVFGDEYGIRVYRKEDEQITVAEARFQIRSAESCKGLFAAADGAARETKAQKCGEGGKADETEIQSYGCR